MTVKSNGFTALAEKHPLNDYITHFEGLTYDTWPVHRDHGRVRRSLDSNVNLEFKSHGRMFQLKLHRDESTFVSSPEEVMPDRSVRPLDTSHIYQGHLEGEPESYVHGSIINGIFSGRIDTPTETFYVDKSEMYFADRKPFHSVVYASADILPELPARAKRSTGAADTGCGLSKSDIHNWMKSVQNSAVDSSTPLMRQKREYTSNYEAFMRRYADPKKPIADRYRRSTGKANNRLCALFLQSDPMLWDYMTRPNTRGGLNYTAQRAHEEITALFASHVDGIKKIYIDTSFNYDTLGPFYGFTFAVHRIQINTTADCDSTLNDNPFCKANIDVSNFLNLNSLTNHDLYCLAYVFTFRDFTQGTLGLAWVGSSLKASGGLCERWKEYNENNRRVYKSLNTGIVTLVNYGTRVPPKVSTLTFAHEIGHNFGSPHDSGPQCVPLLANPNDPNGNYIMYASATSGDRLNNHKFSVCSIGNMTLVLNAVLNEQNGKVNCFGDSQEAFCGNRIVEDKEECDCGFRVDCDNRGDTCCYPQEDAKHCQRKENVQCSPSEGPCCLSSCQFVDRPSHLLCLPDSECSDASYCNGTSSRCPKPEPKADQTPCNFLTQVCRKGECTGSVCEKIGFGWSACSLAAPADDKNFNRGQLCFVSCFNNRTQTCVSSGNKDDVMKTENRQFFDFLSGISKSDGIQLPAGAPCDNFKGYCDVFQKCRAVNEDGPLARLKNLLFNQQTFNDIKDWITEYWWAVLLMVLGLIVLMALFIKVCAVHTPSSNPKQPPARKLTLPRRHTNRSQGHGQPPPYSSEPIPLRPVVSGGPPHGKRRSAARQAASTSQVPPSARQPRQQHFADVAVPGGKRGHRQQPV